MVGGCSAVNFATYNKPSKEDIDSLQMNTKCFPRVELTNTAWETLGKEVRDGTGTDLTYTWNEQSCEMLQKRSRTLV